MSTDNTPASQPSQSPSGPEQHPAEQHTQPLPVERPAPPTAQQPPVQQPQPAPHQDNPVPQPPQQREAQFAHPAAPHGAYQAAQQTSHQAAQQTSHPTAQQGSHPAAPHSGSRPQPYAPYGTPAGAPQGYGYATGQQHAPTPQPAPAPRQKSRWVPVVAAAAGAAVLASGATAGLLTVLDDDAPASSLAEVGAPEQTEAAPVASSTDQNPDWQAVTAAVAPSVVAIQVSSQAGGSEGSGVIIDDAGHVVTNNHVVAGAADGSVQVTLSDGRLFEATIVGTDPTTDLAVVQLVDAPDDLQPATVGDSDAVQVGDSVLAVGNPLGLANTATTGIVSALDRPVAASGEDGSDVVVTNAIQIDAAVNPGNSGGPLFDAQGRVIGITSSIATMSDGSGQSGSIGLGFAIPANLATTVSQQLIEDGTAEHAFLGVTLGDASATADGVTRRGAEVGEVTAGSPAADAGLQAGDVVVAIDDDPVNGAESLTAYVRERTAGEQATVTYVRDGQTQTVDVTFAVREDATASGQGSSGSQDGSQGEDGSGSGEMPWPGQEQGQQGQQGQDDGGSSDSTQPDNIPGWLQELFGN
ncbi:S1C family serine protease [Isoptericola dokdonensis]|uniref:Periplasmic serine endoprotease DegP n=1 Tax=Isoptericola dokdonensis DS-3 TaxID=1300344 RepID=A0A161HY35_9MICO|nr:trypsin-like peptidase domain-containing protein [Isoptericola dokdonensis]ANC31273.1 Periplasmic serine endoprotease DegP precursor [Isoptericola dokdonensis DS-3]